MASTTAFASVRAVRSSFAVGSKLSARPSHQHAAVVHHHQRRTLQCKAAEQEEQQEEGMQKSGTAASGMTSTADQQKHALRRRMRRGWPENMRQQMLAGPGAGLFGSAGLPFPRGLLAHPLFRDVEQALDHFDELIGGEGLQPTSDAMDMLSTPGFAMDIVETTDNYKIMVDLPGLEKKDVTIELMESKTPELVGPLLTIKGKREEEDINEADVWHRAERHMHVHSECMRAVRLPVTADENVIKAHMESGVLSISVAKKETVKPVEKDVKFIDIE